MSSNFPGSTDTFPTFTALSMMDDGSFPADQVMNTIMAAVLALEVFCNGLAPGGITAVADGGTGANLSATGGASQVVRQSTVGGAFTVSALASGDIPWASAGVININQSGSPLATVGAAAPSLHIASASANFTIAQLDAYGTAVSPLTRYAAARGTAAAPTAIQAADSLGSMVAHGYGTNTWLATSDAALIFAAAENFSNTSHGTQLNLLLTPTGGSVTKTQVLTITTASMSFIGQFSAASLSGPLTGNVTGNVSGSAGSCTGNAATATLAAAATTAAACTGNAATVTGLSVGAFTLTVPATGTAALLGTANAFTALQTFPIGGVGGPSINFAGDLTTGIFRIGVGTMGFTSTGANILQLGAAVFLINHNAVATGTAPITGSGDFDLFGADTVNTSLAIHAFGGTPTILAQQAGGTAASLTGTLSGQQLIRTLIKGYQTTTNAFTSSSVPHSVTATEAWSSTGNGYKHIWNTIQSGTLTTAARMTLDNDGSFLLTPAAANGVTRHLISVGGNADVALPTGVEAIDYLLNSARVMTWASTVPVTQRCFRITAPTIACDTAGQSGTTTATLAINNAPQIGTNVTAYTNQYSLWVEAGKTQLQATGIAGAITHTGTTLGFFSAAAAAQSTGYGTPTGGAKQSSFAASTITLPLLAAAVAQLILDLKAYGLAGT